MIHEQINYMKLQTKYYIITFCELKYYDFFNISKSYKESSKVSRIELTKTVPPGKPGKYGSRSFVRASANLWNSLRGERAARL